MIKKFIGWVFPSLSEYEYIYFVTLFITGSIALALTHPQVVQTYFESYKETHSYGAGEVGGYFFVALALAGIGCFPYGMVRYAIKLANPNRVDGSYVQGQMERAWYAGFPTYVVTTIVLFQMAISQAATTNLVQQVISVILLIRGVGMIIIISFWQPFLSERFSNEQASSRDLVVTVSLGFIAGLSLLLTDNWITGFINAYLVGSVLLGVYRKSFKSSENLQPS